MSRIRKTADWELSKILNLLSVHIIKSDEDDPARLYKSFDDWLRVYCNVRLCGDASAAVYKCIERQKDLGFPVRRSCL